jgi:hypothetical protein
VSPDAVARDSAAPGAARSASSWLYAVAAALAVAALLATMNPLFGIRARAWPWALPGPKRWSAETATVFVLGAAALAFVAGALSRPSPRRALAMLVPAWLLVCVFTVTRADPQHAREESTAKAELFGAAMFVAPLLAAVIGGAFAAGLRRDGPGPSRPVLAIGAACLGAFLLYPQYVSAELLEEPGTHAYASPLLVVVRGLFGGPDALVLRDHRVISVLTLLYAALAAVAGWAAIRPRAGRGLRLSRSIGGVALFAGTLAFPVGFWFADGWQNHEGLTPWHVALGRAAYQVFLLHMAPAVAFFASTADLLRLKGATPSRAG